MVATTSVTLMLHLMKVSLFLLQVSKKPSYSQVFSYMFRYSLICIFQYTSLSCFFLLQVLRNLGHSSSDGSS